MPNLTTRLDPIALIREVSFTDGGPDVEDFIKIIERLYQHSVFKDILDLTATLCYHGKLKFSLSEKKFYEIDSGNCKTIDHGVFNSILKSLIRRKKYEVSIKKVKPDVIIHELAHMLEKEGKHPVDFIFADAMRSDINSISNLSLKAATNELMVDGLKGYPASEQCSEQFARYFQLLALSREIAGKDAEYGFSLSDLAKSFKRTQFWITKNVFSFIKPKISSIIAKNSAILVKSEVTIEHKWSEEKVRPMHKPKKSPEWSKIVKSIKE